MADFLGDIDSYFADGVTVTCGATSAKANLDVQDEPIDLGGNKPGVIQQKIQLELPAKYTAFKKDASVTIAGSPAHDGNYRIRQYTLRGDGLTAVALLSKH
jgi:hypothetical protein